MLLFSRRLRAKIRSRDLAARLLRSIRTGDIAMDKGSPQTMLVAAATRFSSGIESGDRIALHIDDLRATILTKVRELYKIRYPYKTEFLY